MTKPGGLDPSLLKLKTEWLANLSMQVGKAVHNPMKSADSLPSAQELLQAIQQYQQQTLAAVSQQPMTHKLARACHDLALVSMVFGHIPPIRLTAIRSLQIPGYKGPCHHRNCSHGSACHGNLLQHLPGQQLHLHVQHHKNELSWKGKAIKVNLPAELSQILHLHLSQGHTLLTDYSGAESTSYVFVDKKGRPFTSSNFTLYWNSMMKGMQAPAITPTNCRHVFVLERRSATRVPGPDDKGAAMVMGHSVQQWDKCYDLSFYQRQAQQAITDMAAWRQALLEGNDLPAATQQQQADPVLAQQDILACISEDESDEEFDDALCDDESSEDDAMCDELPAAAVLESPADEESVEQPVPQGAFISDPWDDILRMASKYRCGGQ